MMAAREATKKAVLVAREIGASSPGAQGLLAAFALSTAGENQLGECLWSLKYDPPRYHAGAFRTAALLLRRAVFPRRGGPAPRVLAAICEAALTEWLNDQCAKCRGRTRTGAGREVIQTRREACRDCRGAGRLFGTSSRWAHYAEAGAIRTTCVSAIRSIGACFTNSRQ